MIKADRFFSISEAAQKLGVSISTLRRWEREGKISIGRTPGGKRLFSEKDIELLTSPLKVEVAVPQKQLKTPNFKFVKPSSRFSILTGLLVVAIIANFYLLSLTPLPHKAVLGVETFLAPAVEEVSPVLSPFFRFFSSLGNSVRLALGGLILSLLPQNTYTTQQITKNVTVSSTSVSDNLTLSSLNVSGNSTLSTATIGSLNVSNDETLGGALTTGGNVTVGTSLETKKDLTVDGNITLSGVINSNTFTSTNLTFAGSSPSITTGTANTSISLNGNGTGGVNLQNGSTGDINFFTTANKITSSGNLTIGGVYNVGGASGKTISACSSSQYLGGIAVTGGIITTLGSCTSIPSSTWNSLQNPTANLSLSMSAFTTTFTWNGATGAGTNLFNLTDTTNNTGTGYLLNVTTQTGSTLLPFHVSAAGTEALTVLANGNVGIGTTSPSVKLEVKGSDTYFTDATGVTLLDINPTTSGVYVYSNYYSGSEQPLYLGTYSKKQAITVQATTGNVGIGTTAPDTKLTVIDSNATESRIELGNTAGYTTSKKLFLALRPTDGYAYLGAFNYNGAGVGLPLRLNPSGGDILIPNSNLSVGATPATTGTIRLPNANDITWKSGTGAGDVTLDVNSSDQYVFNTNGTNPRWTIAAGFFRHDDAGNPATLGTIRLSNADTIKARSVGNDANIQIGTVDASNRVILADSAWATQVLGTSVRIPGIGTTASAANAFIDGADTNNLLRSTSSLRYKNLIGDLSLADADNLILRAEPIIYTSRSKADNPNTVYVGFAAEQIATVDARFITYDEQHLPNWVQYPVFTAPLTLVAQNHEKRLVNLETETNNLLSTVGLPTPTPSASPTPTPTPSPSPTPTPIPNSILSRLDILEKSVLSASSSASFDTLTVLKKLTATDLGLTGKLTQGLLSINGLDSTVASGSATINSLSDLYLQNLGAGGVNILNGKVLIDKNGNLTAQKLNIDIANSTNASIGTATITAGATSINISTTAVTSSSKIFVTLKTKAGKQPLIVTSQTAGSGFTVELEQAYTSDVTFDWWVVN